MSLEFDETVTAFVIFLFFLFFPHTHNFIDDHNSINSQGDLTISVSLSLYQFNINNNTINKLNKKLITISVLRKLKFRRKSIAFYNSIGVESVGQSSAPASGRDWQIRSFYLSKLRILGFCSLNNQCALIVRLVSFEKNPQSSARYS